MKRRGRAFRYLRSVSLALGVLLVAFVCFVLYQTQDEANADLGNIDEILQDLYSETRMAGFGVAVFNAKGVLYTQGFGFADLENRVPYSTTTRQHIASVSKTTIGIALLKAQELGLLTIDDPVNQHLPFQVSNPRFPDREITIRQLATHTSSLDYNDEVVESLYVGEQPVDPSLRAFMEGYFEHGTYGEVTFSDFPPGENWNYSNIGAGLAAYIVERASGETFAEFTQKHIFDPLGLAQTGWFEPSSVAGDLSENDDPQNNTLNSLYYEPTENLKGEDSAGEAGIVAVETSGVILYPARDLITNVEELARYGQAVLSHSPELLSEESYDLLLEASLDSSVSDRTVDNSGLFWMIDRNQYGVTYPLTGINGGDNCINTMLWFDPVLEVGYVFVGNTGGSEANRIRHILIFRALASLGDELTIRNPQTSIWKRARLKGHNLYSRVAALL